MKLEGNGLVFKKLKGGTRSLENDRNSTTLDKEIRLCSMTLFIYVLNNTPPYLKFFPFLYTILPIWNSFLLSAQSSSSAIISFSLHNYSRWFPWFSRLIFELQIMFFFLPQSKGNSWCLTVPAMEGHKGVTPSSNYWKVITRIIRIFWFPILFYLIVSNLELYPRLACFVS
jgi:hypothetical protein